jgi:hypothetical protein
MDFIDWDPMARAGLFGAIFLVSLFAVLWLWYDGSGGQSEGRWYWRIAASVLVALTIPAVVLGAANLDSDREDLMNILAWVAFGAGAFALLTVGSYAVWGRELAEELAPQPEPFANFVEPPTLTPAVRDEPPTLRPAPPASPAEAYFFVKAGPDKGKQYAIHDVATIGRGENCVIAVGDRRVSSEHAQVKRSDGAYVFFDLGSTNGSFLIVEGRDQQIRSPQVLVDGDEIRIGHTVLAFVDTRGNGKRK